MCLVAGKFRLSACRAIRIALHLCAHLSDDALQFNMVVSEHSGETVFAYLKTQRSRGESKGRETCWICPGWVSTIPVISSIDVGFLFPGTATIYSIYLRRYARGSPYSPQNCSAEARWTHSDNLPKCAVNAAAININACMIVARINHFLVWFPNLSPILPTLVPSKKLSRLHKACLSGI